jgi:hypothetical protein
VTEYQQYNTGASIVERSRMEHGISNMVRASPPVTLFFVHGHQVALI